MNFLGVIPARGGSKGISRKNLVEICGYPLIHWSIRAAQESNLLSDFLISTEDPEIAELARGYGAKVLDRPGELASDSATTLQVLQDLLGRVNCDALVLLQPTSPVRHNRLIDDCIRAFEAEPIDSLATGSWQHCYEWGKFNNLPRQALEGWFYDDGNIYIHKKDHILRGQWVGERRKTLEIEKIYNFEIDDPIDLMVVENLLATVTAGDSFTS